MTSRSNTNSSLDDQFYSFCLKHFSLVSELSVYVNENDPLYCLMMPHKAIFWLIIDDIIQYRKSRLFILYEQWGIVIITKRVGHHHHLMRVGLLDSCKCKNIPKVVLNVRPWNIIWQFHIWDFVIHNQCYECIRIHKHFCFAPMQMKKCY